LVAFVTLALVATGVMMLVVKAVLFAVLLCINTSERWVVLVGGRLMRMMTMIPRPLQLLPYLLQQQDAVLAVRR
jgi:hypothetical protein